MEINDIFFILNFSSEIINIFVIECYSNMYSIVKFRMDNKYYLLNQGFYGNQNFSSTNLEDVYNCMKGGQYNLCKNVFDHKILINVKNKKKKEINTIIGDDNTFGHHYWQDLSWFFYILENNKLDYFKTIYVYHDKFNLFNLIEKLIKDNNYNTKVCRINNFEEIDNSKPLFKFRMKKVTKFQRNHILNYYDSLYKNKLSLEKDYFYINVFLRIKKCPNSCIQKFYDLIKKIVPIIKEKYGKKVKFLIDGYINFEENLGENFEIGPLPNGACLYPNDKEIIQFVNPEFNLIKKNINEIIPYYYHIDLHISVPSSALTIPSYIFNKNIICIDDISKKKFVYKGYDKLYEGIDTSKINYFKSEDLDNIIDCIDKLILSKS